MGRKPNQEGRKEYLENPRTHFTFSDASDFRKVFKVGGTSEMYLTPATKGKRLGKETFRIVAHLPNKYHDDRDNYLAKMNSGSMSRFMPNGSLPASRIRWDGASNAGAHLILHTQDGKRVEFYLVGLGDRNPRGAMVYATAVFPSQTTRKLVQCPVQVGFFGQSKSKPGQFKLTFQKPRMECGKNLAKAGHVPESFLKPDKKGKAIKAAEGGNYLMAEDCQSYFYEAQGMDYNNLPQTQDVKIMNSETGQQATERAYYDPSTAMVGTDETLDGYQIIDSSTVDLTSNQPMANYGAESMGECFSCGENAVSESLGHCLDCGQQYNAESKRMMCADCGSNSVKYAEETATYSPSEEPDMVSSSSFEDPTNANFSAEGEPSLVISIDTSGSTMEGNVNSKYKKIAMRTINDLKPPNVIIFDHNGNVQIAFEGSADDALNFLKTTTNLRPRNGTARMKDVMDAVMGIDGHKLILTDLRETRTKNAEEPIAVAEGTSLTGYSPIDSIEEPAPIGHGVNQYFGSDTESALLDESTMDIGIEEGTSLDNFSGVDSVAVEAPLGHGVTQWYAENTDGPKPNFDEGITGQDGPSADPTNAHMKAEFSKSKGRNYARNSKGRIITHDAQGYNDKMDESLGMRHRGSHSQSMKDRRDEASAMDKGHSRMGRKYDDVMTMDADTAGYLQGGSLSMDGYTPLESVDVDRTSYQPTQNYGADQEIDMSFKDSVKVGTGLSVGLAAGSLLLGVAAMLGLGAVGSLMGKEE